MEMERLIAVLRRPEEPVVLTSRSRFVFSDIPGEHTDGRLDSFYEIVETPLFEVNETLYPARNRLLESWIKLVRVREWNDETLFHLMVVLLETAPVYPKLNTAPQPLNLSDGLRPFKPTAANPRAYRGTKDRPPKPRRLPAIDLRPHICDPKSLKRILNRLGNCFESAAGRLSEIGYHDLSSIKWDVTKADAFDPYMRYYHSDASHYPAVRLPKDFTTFILPYLKRRSWPEVQKFLALYWGLVLNKKNRLLWAVSRLLSCRTSPETAQWLHIIANQPQNRRRIFTTLLIETGAWQLDPEKYPLADFKRFHDLTPKKEYGKKLHILVRSLMEGVDFEYMLTGFSLADKYKPNYEFILDRGDFADASLATIEKLYTRVEEHAYREMPLRIWQACGLFPGLSKKLETTPWNKFSPITTYYLLRFLLNFYDYYDSYELEVMKWKLVDGQWKDMLEILDAIDEEYQVKFLDFIEFFVRAPRNIEFLSDNLQVVYRLLKRLCGPPFKTWANTKDFIIDSVYMVQKSDREAFLSAPDSSFINLEKACRSKNKAQLIEKGHWHLMNADKEYSGNLQFIVRSFTRFPRRYLRVTRSFACARRYWRYVIFKEFLRHPLMRTDFETLSVEELGELVDDHIIPGITNPIPKKLGEYLNGKCQLTADRQARYKRRLLEKLDLTRLDILEAMLTEDMKTDYPLEEETENWKHTLQFINYLFENRRQFKRFLRAYWKGDTTYLLEHPVTKAWIGKHRDLNISLWTTGITMSKELDGQGKITLSIEQDPLEVLKMGTYVGTCLGLGGGLEYSAGASVLDINKQIIYARDERGTVAARQLIAISEENELVCFYIYPLNSTPEIISLFREYDLELASQLGMRVYDFKNNDGYTIENILSKGWWDDGEWDFKDIPARK